MIFCYELPKALTCVGDDGDYDGCNVRFYDGVVDSHGACDQ